MDTAAKKIKIPMPKTINTQKVIKGLKKKTKKNKNENYLHKFLERYLLNQRSLTSYLKIKLDKVNNQFKRRVKKLLITTKLRKQGQ